MVIGIEEQESLHLVIVEQRKNELGLLTFQFILLAYCGEEIGWKLFGLGGKCAVDEAKGFISAPEVHLHWQWQQLPGNRGAA